MFAPQPLYSTCLGAASQIAQMLIFLVVVPLEHNILCGCLNTILIQLNIDFNVV
jgi:hypothetical protein